MSSTPLATDLIRSAQEACPAQTARPLRGPVCRMARKAVLSLLDRLQDTDLRFVDETGKSRHLGQAADSDTARFEAEIHIHNPAFYRRVAFGGHLAAAQAYIDGDWSCPDLTPLIRSFIHNADLSWKLERGPAKLVTRPLAWIRHHLVNRNTREGARQNIQNHYDLGNDFFSAFLDPTMTYSAGIFASPETTLEESQVAKYDRICQAIDLKPSDHLVEIGTGWGGFAIHAASRYGCRVTTTTISQRQHDLAAERIADAGLGDRIELRLQDYRDLDGTYDKLVSIEMIEAIGHQQYPTYFRKCADLLKPAGAACIQAITIADQLYEQAKNDVDFIKHYIFPGSCIPSVTALTQAMTRHSDLRLSDLFDFTHDYATTLRQWRENTLLSRSAIQNMGYPESLLRLWDFYLCYCEGGFRERNIGVVHLTLTKPAWRTSE